MNSESSIAISAAVVAFVQLLKWAGMPGKVAPLLVIVLSAGGTWFYVWSMGSFQRALGFDYFAAGVNVALAAAGVFGFTRDSHESVTTTKRRPAEEPPLP